MHTYQDISTRMYPQPACRSLQLNLENVYALVVLFIYWETIYVVFIIKFLVVFSI